MLGRMAELSNEQHVGTTERRELSNHSATQVPNGICEKYRLSPTETESTGETVMPKIPHAMNSRLRMQNSYNVVTHA